MRPLLIKNVRLEKKHHYNEEGHVIFTETEQVDLVIEHGIIVQIGSNIMRALPILDVKGALALPAFREMHIHLDKTYFSGPWKAVRPATNGLATRIEEEQVILLEQLPVAKQRAHALVQHLMHNGHRHIRTHVNVDRVIGTQHIELMQEVLADYPHITSEIVAFPQHGLLQNDVVDLMKEALEMGADLVGGIDPATMERDINGAIDTMVELAVQYGKGIDMHLHDGGSLGAYEMEIFAEKVMAANLYGQATISHAFALADVSGATFNRTVEKVAEAQIDVTTSVPISRAFLPVAELYNRGVDVSTGHDSLTDHWSPFGTGDTIQKLSRLAERVHAVDELSLSRALRYATGGVTPLDDYGARAWPSIGDQASFIFVDASCSAETIARRSAIRHVVLNGQQIK